MHKDHNSFRYSPFVVFVGTQCRKGGPEKASLNSSTSNDYHIKHTMA